MDPHIARLLNDKLYEKRKTGALEYVVYIVFLIHPPLLPPYPHAPLPPYPLPTTL